MRAMERQFELMGLDKLREAAIRREEHDDEQAAKVDAAARVFVDRLVDMELERRLVLRHNNPGYSSVSPTLLIGEPVHHDNYKCSKEVVGCPVSSPWHDRARDTLGSLAPRQYVAVLIRAAKDDHKSTGVWAKTYDEITNNIDRYLMVLGFTGRVREIVKYENGRSIRKAAHRAKVELMILAKAGVI